MRFIDEATIHVQSGRGGNGASSFRREKYVAFGGPDGGDGGRGGDVVLQATTRRSTLIELRGHAIWRAASGQSGGARGCTGANADHIVIEVPVGTRVFDEETETVLVDLVEDGQSWVAAEGGRGGLGNVHFKTSTNRAPRKTTPGKPGQERRLRLELLLMADVGLLGFPNAGKSTFISRVSAARPRVADYPFTTLAPSLGVVHIGDDSTFVVADIPGLIEGASEGAGLGHRFLRHVQRTRTLLHLVSLGPDEALPPAERYRILRRELARYDADMLDKPEVILLTKADLLGEDARAEALAALSEAAPGRTVVVGSAVSGEGIQAVVGHLWALVQGAS